MFFRWPSCRRWRRSWWRLRGSSELENTVSHQQLTCVDTNSGSTLRYYVCAPPLRLLRRLLRRPPGCLHDQRAERGDDGRRGAPEAPPARCRPPQRRPEAPQAGRAHSARPDALAAAEVRHSECRSGLHRASSHFLCSTGDVFHSFTDVRWCHRESLEAEKPKKTLPLFGAMKGGSKFKLKTGTIGVGGVTPPESPPSPSQASRCYLYSLSSSLETASEAAQLTCRALQLERILPWR